MTDRERLLARLPTSPMVRGDVLVVLCGEDCVARWVKAYELMGQGAAQVMLLTGGRAGRGLTTAEQVEPKLLAMGVVPSAIYRDDAAQNTHEQAENTIALARRHGWRRLLLVASSYHAYRAYLTFLRTILDAGLEEEYCLLPVFADKTRWTDRPEDLPQTREHMLVGELSKIELYGAKGHCASYSDALDYLDYWEQRL